MKNLGTVNIETERLILRRFIASDAPSAYRNWMGDCEVTKYLRWQAHESVTVSEDVIGRWISDYTDDRNYLWAIELKEIGEPVGTIAVVEQDEYVESVQIGYCIGSSYWHRGIMSEAFGAVIKFLFEEVGVNRIEAQHDPANPNSGAVMKKCGLIYEGTMREADFNNTGIVDAAIYGITAGDYFNSGKK